MTKTDQHFIYNFWFIIFITTVVFSYIWAVTFIPIPEKNVRFVDTAFGFLLGSVLAAGVGYLLGGTPEKKPVDGTSADATTMTTIKTESVTIDPSN